MTTLISIEHPIESITHRQQIFWIVAIYFARFLQASGPEKRARECRDLPQSHSHSAWSTLHLPLYLYLSEFIFTSPALFLSLCHHVLRLSQNDLGDAWLRGRNVFPAWSDTAATGGEVCPAWFDSATTAGPLGESRPDRPNLPWYGVSSNIEGKEVLL